MVSGIILNLQYKHVLWSFELIHENLLQSCNWNSVQGFLFLKHSYVFIFVQKLVQLITVLDEIKEHNRYL